MKIISSDLLRGHIDTFVLSALMQGKMYGNGIRRFIEEKTNGIYHPNEQSLYTAYHRLEDNGCVKGEWGEGDVQRKYYSITQKGIDTYRYNVAEWETAKKLIDILIKD
ncbi:MAG TPA: helix-turn-helix transcriptional regulator [Eubacteriales bacterium]|nr:helix-turn-helix transcriptional regulator [Clostridia bacterium]HRX14259.1 helix-turn-helix transcriptional regulator [Eubacteriales bacterium]